MARIRTIANRSRGGVVVLREEEDLTVVTRWVGRRQQGSTAETQTAARQTRVCIGQEERS
jgi:hypothetical protein